MDDLKAMIVGSILGDGSVRRRVKKNTCMSFGHCEKQEQYLRWKVSIFEKYGLHTGRVALYVHKSDRYKSGECRTWHSVTRMNALFNFYRENFYDESGKKYINFEHLDVSPMALAIWFMDDGQKCTRSYQINTQSFSREELEKLCKYLLDKYELEFTIDKLNVLYLRTKCIKRFESIIEPYLHETMRYKLRVLGKEEELLES